MRFEPRLGLVADFVIRFNLDLLPATTAPVMFNVEVTGAARLYRAASRDRREQGRPPCYATRLKNSRYRPQETQ
jgi:hypothetical protein